MLCGQVYGDIAESEDMAMDYLGQSEVFVTLPERCTVQYDKLLALHCTAICSSVYVCVFV